jgi:hypothetical protein
VVFASVVAAAETATDPETVAPSASAALATMVCAPAAAVVVSQP